jgi:hypothetical protein
MPSNQLPTVPYPTNAAASGTEIPPGGDRGVLADGPQACSGSGTAYELLEEIAVGWMGIVYKARHTTMDRVVALKTMRASPAAEPQLALRFQREVQAIARLRHTHIVPIYETGTLRGKLYYTMAYLPGGTLAGQRQRLLGEPRTAVALVEKVARAVQYAHEQGVLHRDLKPGNVLLDEQGEPQVSDFGLAKLQDADLELTQTGAVMGTLAYMAPEQAAGRLQEVSPATDVWALGVILFELLTGRRPFVGDSREDVKRRIIADEPPQPRTLRPELDRDLERILQRCLKKVPGQRYLSAGRLAEDLAGYLRGEPISETEILPRSKRFWGWVALAAFAAVAGVGAYLMASGFFRTSDHEPAPSLGPVETLIDADGQPLQPWRFIVGGQASRGEQAKEDRSFVLSSRVICLLELKQAPPWPHFALEAQVRHDAGKFEDVGIYFGYQTCRSARGDQHTFFRFCFRDNQGGPLAAHFSFIPHLWPETLVSSEELAHDWLQPPRNGEAREWRPLAIEVHAGEMRFFNNRQALNPRSNEELDKSARLLLRQLGDCQWHYAPQGGIGLYVYRGTASFRNVVLRPLP